MQKRSFFTFKVVFLLAIFLVEMAFAAFLLHRQGDDATVRAFIALPVVGERYYEFKTEDLREAAGRGDVSAMMTLHSEALDLEREADAAAVMNQIRMSSSPTAILYAYEYDRENWAEDTPFSELSEREMLLLRARVLHENVRPPFRDETGEAYVRQSQRNATALAALLEQARNGDSDAQWLIGELNRQ